MPITPSVEITQVVDLIAPDPQGQLRTVTRVSYRLPNGYTGQIEIPKAEATPQKIKTLIDADVQRVMAIYGLSS